MSTAVKVVTFPNKLAEKKCRELMVAIQHEFDTMDWVKTYDRKTVSGLGSCYSMAFGLVIQPSQGVKISRFNDKFPHLYSLLQQLCSCFDFPCTTFTINKNLLCQPHKDKHNQGESIIFSLGNFTGGEFIVEDGKDDTDRFKQYDIFNRPTMFNGAKSTHFTAPFEGNRYSVVLYNLPMDKWKSEEEKKLVLSNKNSSASSVSSKSSLKPRASSASSVFFVAPMDLPILPSTPSSGTFDSPKGRKKAQSIQPIQSIHLAPLNLGIPHQFLPSYLSADNFNPQSLEHLEQPEFGASSFLLPLPLSPRKTRARNTRQSILFPQLHF